MLAGHSPARYLGRAKPLLGSEITMRRLFPFLWLLILGSGCAAFPRVLATPALAVAGGVQVYAADALEGAVSALPPLAESGQLALWLSESGGLTQEEAALVEAKLGPEVARVYLLSLPRYVGEGAITRSVEAALSGEDSKSYGAGELARFLLSVAEGM